MKSLGLLTTVLILADILAPAAFRAHYRWTSRRGERPVRIGWRMG